MSRSTISLVMLRPASSYSRLPSSCSTSPQHLLVINILCVQILLTPCPPPSLLIHPLKLLPQPPVLAVQLLLLHPSVTVPVTVTDCKLPDKQGQFLSHKLVQLGPVRWNNQTRYNSAGFTFRLARNTCKLIVTRSVVLFDRARCSGN